MQITKKLQGKVVLITGATGSMGSAVAKRFSHEGASLILVARNIERLRLLSAEIQEMGVSDENLMLVSLDLEDFDGVKNLASTITLKYKYLDVLVSSAAILGDSRLIQDYESDMWNKVININLNSNWNLIKNFDPLLKLSPAGRVIFITSETIQSPASYLYWGLYALSKSALETMVKIYAAETKHSKLYVNLVYPGAVNSRIYSQAFSSAINHQQESDSIKLIAPEELTDKILELASDDCNTTGQSYQLLPVH